MSKAPPRRDAPPKLWLVAIIAVVAFVIGVGLVRLTLEAPGPLQAPEIAPQQATQAPEAPPPAATRDAGSRAIRVRPGRVAYLRCEGVRIADGEFPCPRDREFERNAWAAIGALSHCQDAPSRPATVDVRYDIERGSRPNVRVLSEAAEEDRAKVERCIAGALGGVTPRLDARRLIVSFELSFDPTLP